MNRVMMTAADVADSRYRGKCVFILIIDTGLIIFDIVRSVYSIILDFVTTATESHHLNSLYKHVTSGNSASVVPATAEARKGIHGPSSSISSSPKISAGGSPAPALHAAETLVTTAKPSSFNLKTLISTFATEILNTSESSSMSDLEAINATSSNQQKTLGQFKSSSGSSEITLNFKKTTSASASGSTTDEQDVLIFGYACTVALLLVQIWAIRTLWKAIKPEVHPNLAAKCCRKYCNYILFPRVPFVLFKWSIVGITFALGENSVIAVFGLIYCVICFRCVNELGKELIEVISASASTRMSSIATTLTNATCQNNIAFPHLASHPDGLANLASATTTTVGFGDSIGSGGGGSASAGGDEDDDDPYRKTTGNHEIPKHERIGFKV